MLKGVAEFRDSRTPGVNNFNCSKVMICEMHMVRAGDMLAVSVMMKTIKIKTLLEVLLRDASG
jgi:hypothetical protein